MRYLKQSTSVDVPIGPFLDATDGVTAETALTITQPDIRLKKNGAAWAQKNAAQTLTHEENGFYEVTLDATDTNTLGLLRLAVFETGAMPVWEDFVVLAANVYDSLIGGGDLLDINVSQYGGTNGTFSGGRPEVNTSHIGGSAISQAAGVANVNVTQLSGDATAADNAEAFFDGTGYAGTNNVIPTVTNLTNAPTNGDLTATMKASVNAEVDAALNTAIPVSPTANSINERIATLDDNYTAARAPNLDNLDTTVSSRLASAGYTAPDNTSITAIKAKTDSLTFTVANQVDANIQSVNDVTVTGNGQAGSEWGP